MNVTKKEWLALVAIVALTGVALILMGGAYETRCDAKKDRLVPCLWETYKTVDSLRVLKEGDGRAERHDREIQRDETQIQKWLGSEVRKGLT